MACKGHRSGLSLLELAISLAVVALLLAILIPTLSNARTASYREQCAGNQRQIGGAWTAYVSEHECLPHVSAGRQSAWEYGGVRFSRQTGQPFGDLSRPLNRYLPPASFRNTEHIFCCPGDCGIAVHNAPAAGTAGKTAFETFGTSYRANTLLLDARLSGLDEESRGLRLDEITTAPAATVIMGDAVWYEVLNPGDGRTAIWHKIPNAGNMLFLDGSVRFMTIDTDSKRVEAMFRPVAAPTTDSK